MEEEKKGIKRSRGERARDAPLHVYKNAKINNSLCFILHVSSFVPISMCSLQARDKRERDKRERERYAQLCGLTSVYVVSFWKKIPPPNPLLFCK